MFSLRAVYVKSFHFKDCMNILITLLFYFVNYLLFVKVKMLLCILLTYNQRDLVIITINMTEMELM